MSLCPTCGERVPQGFGSNELCAHHPYQQGGAAWSEENRIWCAYFHRGVEIERVEEA